jgi:hypothetical protein
LSALCLGVPPRCSLGVPLKRFLASRRSRAAWSCAGLRLSKNLRFLFPSIQPLFFEEADCKGTTFLDTGNQKFQLFLIKHYTILTIN